MLLAVLLGLYGSNNTSMLDSLSQHSVVLVAQRAPCLKFDCSRPHFESYSILSFSVAIQEDRLSIGFELMEVELQT
ncbi:unnamed protein product [Urochloa humidicola]